MLTFAAVALGAAVIFFLLSQSVGSEETEGFLKIAAGVAVACGIVAGLVGLVVNQGA